MDLGLFLAALNALLSALGALLTKRLTLSDDPDKIEFLMTALMTPIALLPALPVWTWPTATYAPFIVALGPLAVLVHVCFVRSLAAAETSFVMNFDFVRLPLARLSAAVVFGANVTVSAVIGAALIFGAVLCCYWTEPASRLPNVGGSK